MEIPVKSNGKPDIEKLMQLIQADVERSVKENGYTMPKFISKKVESAELESIKSCESLKYLNHNWNDWSVTPNFNSHRKGIGPVISKFKTLFNRLIKNNLKGYFEKELTYQKNLVRHLNNSSKYIDESHSKIFWSLIEKIDTDIEMVNQRNDELFSSLIDEIDNLKQKLSKLEQ